MLALRYFVLLGFCLSAAISAFADTRQEALDYINKLRESASMTPFEYDLALAKSASNHAQYLAFHGNAANNISAVPAHEEVEGDDFFTGETSADRVLAAGYAHGVVGENVARGDQSLVEAIDGLMGAIYHRLTFLNFSYDQIGLAEHDFAQVFELGRKDLQQLCVNPPDEAVYSAGVNCLGTIVKKRYYDSLCDNTPQSALFKQPWPESCPHGGRLDADYMTALCKKPLTEALRSGNGSYYTICNGRRRVSTNWFENFCGNLPEGAGYRRSGGYYELCDDGRKVASEWLNSMCRSAPLSEQLMQDDTYQKVCRSDVKIRTAFLEQHGHLQAEKNPDIVVWPPANSNDIPPVFYEETPDPLPDYSISGYPVSIQINPSLAASVELLQFRLFKMHEDTLTEIEHVRLLDKAMDPNSKLNASQFALFPLTRLDWAQNYQVQALLNINGSEVPLTWQFRTREFAAEIITVKHGTKKIVISPKRDYVLYFAPIRDQSRTVGSIRTRFRQGTKLNIEVLDSSTIKLRVENKRCDSPSLDVEYWGKLNIALEGC